MIIIINIMYRWIIPISYDEYGLFKKHGVRYALPERYGHWSW